MNIQKPYDPCAPIQRINKCWDMTQDFDAWIKNYLTELFEDNPSLIPVPPVVTDGTAAAPGTVGEIFTTTIAGTWNGTASGPPPANYVILPNSLPPGDWDGQWLITVSGQISGAMMRFAPAPTGAANDMTMFGVTIPNLTSPDAGVGTMPMMLASPVTPIVNQYATGLVFNLYVWTQGITANGAYTASFGARRRR